MLSTQISADGEYIVACDYDGYINFFHRDSSTPIWKSVDENRNGMLEYASISANGQYFVARETANNQISLFSKDSNSPVWNFTGGDDVGAVAISEDGEYVVVGSGDLVYLLDKDSNTPIWSYTLGDEVISVSISADSRYITAGSTDDKVYTFKNNYAGFK